ncbi:threonine/homoserine/homoserine lactone efflux protein [Amaricoccus macauensis]|uniref:Threonine/homoserine/homoserine lactone efflux protein n=1 Tax=Amaricoccus macauensis TaxID=57001 RepID=A0A840ST07_9RHOB|nr:threonine/homoserine/homoserine lactone efflux protein [Amaricoccus macauensis]
MTIAGFAAIAFLSLMAALSPGPAVMLSARTGLTEGMRAGACLAVGIGIGATIWAAAAFFGLAIVFSLAPTLLVGLKIVGCAYLLWTAWHLWRNADLPLVDAGAPRAPRSSFAAFRHGLLMQLANPKTAVMFSAIFVGIVPPGTPLAVKAALLAVVFLNETLWNVFVARIFSLERSRAAYLRLKGVIDRAFGGLIAFLGVKIIAT